MVDADRVARETEQRLSLLEAELARLRQPPVAAPPTPGQAAAARLDQRPDVVRFINSRLGWVVLALLQHGVWAARHRTRRFRLLIRRPASPPQLAASSRATPPAISESVAIQPSPVPPPLSVEPSPAPIAEPDTPPAPAHDAAATSSTPEPVTPAVAPGPSLSAIAYEPAILRRRPRILIDVTPTSRRPPFTGGIARVIHALGEAGVRTGLALPVRIVDGALHPYFSHTLLHGPITPDGDDIYVLADVFWFHLPEYRDVVARVRAAGARVAMLVHDLGPIRFPALFRDDMPPLFRAGLLEMLQHCAFCLGISQHVENDLRAYLDSIGFPSRKSLVFGHFLLGVTRKPIGTARLRREVTELFDGRHAFLSVGTLEPRKGYDVTLDAAELAWLSGANFVLVIIGRYGWAADALRARIEAHPELDRRLFWLQDASDAELAYAYTRCRCLVQSSLDEGFCLPVSEACLFGAAVISSDLPVIREIAGSSVRYYAAGSHEQLARLLNEALAEAPPPADFPVRSWTEAMEALAVCLADAAPPRDDGRAMPMPTIRHESLDPIHVACCFDDAMAMPAGVLAASVAATTRDTSVVFHMVHAPGLSTDLGALRRALETPRFRIVEHPATGDTSDLYSTDQYTSAVYYRLMIPDLIEADKVIYLDSDMMARRSLLGLWELDLEGHPIAASVDFLTLSHKNGDLAPVVHAGKVFMVGDYCREILGIDMDKTPYFNSGVMVMDLEAWRRTGLAARCRAQCHRGRALSLVDQDAANQILQGDFLHLDPRWNAFVFLEGEYWPRAGDELPSIMSGYEQDLCPPTGDLQAAMRAWADDPWIVHFAHRSKPWRADDRRTAFDDEFWEHAFRTPYGPQLHLEFFGPLGKIAASSA